MTTKLTPINGGKKEGTMKIGYSDIGNPRFKEAIKNLANQPINGEAKFKVKKIIEALDVVDRKMISDRNDFIQRFTVKDDKGEPKQEINEEGNPTGRFEMNKELEKESEAVVKAHNEYVYEFEAKPLYEYELLNVAISAVDLKLLENFIQAS